MNWLSLAMSSIACLLFFTSGYSIGKKKGHLDGHKCEAVMQIFFEEFQTATRKDTDERLP